MYITDVVKKIVSQYEGESIALKTNLVRLFSTGKLHGTGKMIVLAVDQGFEHGPDKIFAMNPMAYDPHYAYHIATKYNLNALAAPLGLLQTGAETFLGQIPLILKLNSSNLLMHHHLEAPDQARTSSVKDAVRLGCIGVGFTVYPGSKNFLEQLEELKDISAQAREYGLIVIVWSYVRGYMPKDEETSLDLVTYGAHMACLMGGHIIKVKVPQDKVHMPEIAQKIASRGESTSDLTARVRHIIRGSFTGRRIVIFSGGEIKDDDILEKETLSILKGGGHGSIVGRNFFQRPEEEAKKLIETMQSIYLKKET